MHQPDRGDPVDAVLIFDDLLVALTPMARPKSVIESPSSRRRLRILWPSKRSSSLARCFELALIVGARCGRPHATWPSSHLPKASLSSVLLACSSAAAA